MPLEDVQTLQIRHLRSDYLELRLLQLPLVRSQNVQDLALLNLGYFAPETPAVMVDAAREAIRDREIRDRQYRSLRTPSDFFVAGLAVGILLSARVFYNGLVIKLV